LGQVELRAIVEAWSLKLPEPAILNLRIQDLLPRLRSEDYFRPMEASLPKVEQLTLKFLAIHGGILEPDELLERQFSGHAAACDGAIGNLRRAGLVFSAELDCPEPAPILFIPGDYLPMIELPPHVDGFLGKLLRNAAPEVLADTAKRLFGNQKVLESDHALALRLRRILLDPVELMSLIGSLSDVEHEIFRILTDRRGFALYKDLLENVTSKKVDHSRAEVLNGLLYGSGLAFVASEGHNKHMNLAAIPRDILWMVGNGFRPDVRSMEEIDTLAAPAGTTDHLQIHENTGRILRDLAILAAKVDVHRVRKLAAGGINRIELRRIHEIVAPSKPISYVELLSHFLIQNKHLFEIHGRWRAADGLRAWFSKSNGCWRDLYGWWLRTTAWAEDLYERTQTGPDSHPLEGIIGWGWVPSTRAWPHRSTMPYPNIPGGRVVVA
jgi:hypothetical protein